MTVVIVVGLDDGVVSTGNTRRKGSAYQSRLQKKFTRPAVTIPVIVIIIITGEQVDIPIVIKIRKN